MSRRKYRILAWIAHNLHPWFWFHLVPDRTRGAWGLIAAALVVPEFHVADWGTAGHPMPAWVPCAKCAGQPCRRVPPWAYGQGAALDPDPYLAALLGRLKE